MIIFEELNIIYLLIYSLYCCKSVRYEKVYEGSAFGLMDL